MTSRKFFFFGDSHTSYLSNDKNVRLVQLSAKENFENWPAKFTIDKCEVDNRVFFWKHACTAWSVTYESLKEMSNGYTPQPGDVCFFSFGSVDLTNKLATLKNARQVVHKYMIECLRFCSDNGAIPIFVSPFYNGHSDQYDAFIKYLTDECSRHKLFAPIVLSDNAISRFYIGDDIYNHLNEDDAKKALDYILKEFDSYE